MRASVEINFPFLIASLAVSAAITHYFVKWWIKRAFEMGLVGRDMNKRGNVAVAEAGGVWATFGSAMGLLVLVALHKYLLNEDFYVNELMALTLLLFMSSFLGFLDDILGWKRGVRPIYRVLLMIPLSIPLVVIRAGVSEVSIPVVGRVDLGLVYPLVLVPIGVMGSSNAFNMIAGYNGLEALQGIIILGYTAMFSYFSDLPLTLCASMVMIASLLAFLAYNWYPARVFPGNSMTYGLGAYYASLVILGNFEKFGVLLFSLYFVELALFLRGLIRGVYKENFGVVREDGALDPPYDRSYSLTHVALKLQIKIRGRATERGVVCTIALMQVAVGLIALALVKYV